jgi:hypothetical protein
MAGQGREITTGTKIAIAIASLLVAAAYFTFLDWGAMKVQGLDYFYMFRK